MKTETAGHGANSQVLQQVDKTHAASRVSLRPPDKGVLSSGRLAMWSGVVAAGMTGPLPIWEMRWWPEGANALIRRLRFMAMADGTAFAPGSCIFGLYKATSFSVLSITNSVAAPTIGQLDLRKSTRMGQTKLQSSTRAFSILDTSASGLTGGTRTINLPLAFAMGSVGAFPLARICECDLISPNEAGRDPEELATNEGLVLNAALIAGTGTWKFGVEVEWDEIDPARYFANV